MTEYIVLRRSERDQEFYWLNVKTTPARSARSAIAQYVNGDGANNPDAEYVAVPARSWRPVTVKVETKTALKFS